MLSNVYVLEKKLEDCPEWAWNFKFWNINHWVSSLTTYTLLFINWIIHYCMKFSQLSQRHKTSL